jgi:predicted kinase
VARRYSARLVVLECRADEAVLQARLAARASEAASTSDARLELWPSLKASFVEPTDLEKTATIDTTQPIERQLEIALQAL